ncbi:MAG: hypothetical protein WBG30_08820 [Psychrilyobacter sp.]
MEKKKLEKYKKLSADIEKLMKENIYGEFKVIFVAGLPTATTIVSNKKY